MFLLPWFFAIGLAIADEIVVTMLLRRQYVGFKSAWEADGRPRGVLWIPEEAKLGGWYATYASGHAGQLARWRWLFKNPDWTTKDVDARRLMLLHRVFLPVFMVCVVAPFVIAAMLQ